MSFININIIRQIAQYCILRPYLVSFPRYEFIFADLWLLNCPDLHPADYQINGILQQRVYHRKVQDVDGAHYYKVLPPGEFNLSPWSSILTVSRRHAAATVSHNSK